MPPVNSSHVSSIDHDGRALVVRYWNGETYHYPDVPRFLYSKMLKEIRDGGSAGQILNQHIKPHYEAHKQHRRH
jgi:hypothetical protein